MSKKVDYTLLILVIILVCIICVCISNDLFTKETFVRNHSIVKGYNQNYPYLGKDKYNIIGNGEIRHGGFVKGSLRHGIKNGIEIESGAYNHKNDIELPCGDEYKLHKTHKDTLCSREKRYLKMLIKKVLNKINRDIKLNFQLIEFEHISRMAFRDGNIRYIAECFVHEIHNYYNRRIIFDLFIDNKENSLYVNKITLANARQTEKEKEPIKNDDYPFDHKILDDNNIKNTNHIIGKSETTLDFDLLDYKPENFNNTDFKSWVLPKEYLNTLNNDIKVWPCRTEDIFWDENGVNYTEPPSNKCKGINTSYSRRNLNPKFLPSMKSIDGNSEYNWLFGNHKGDGRNIFMGGRGYGVN